MSQDAGSDAAGSGGFLPITGINTGTLTITGVDPATGPFSGGTTAVLRHTRADSRRNPWGARLLERKPARLVTVALANKTAPRLGEAGEGSTDASRWNASGGHDGAW